MCQTVSDLDGVEVRILKDEEMRIPKVVSEIAKNIEAVIALGGASARMQQCQFLSIGVKCRAARLKQKSRVVRFDFAVERFKQRRTRRKRVRRRLARERRDDERKKLREEERHDIQESRQRAGSGVGRSTQRRRASLAVD